MGRIPQESHQVGNELHRTKQNAQFRRLLPSLHSGENARRHHWTIRFSLPGKNIGGERRGEYSLIALGIRYAVTGLGNDSVER
jgi:hypothetical protein